MGVLPFVENIPKGSVINKQEHFVLREKVISLKARKHTDTLLVKVIATSNIFKNCLKEIDCKLYENIFMKII